MRIAVNATILDGKPTGLGTYTNNVVQEISKHIGPKDKLIVFTSYPEAFRGFDLEIRRVSKWVQPKYGNKAGVFRFLWTQIAFPIRLIKDRVDLIYNTTHHGAFFAGRLQIMTIHDLCPIRFPQRYKLQYYYFKFMLPILLKSCSVVITNSESAKKDIYNYYNMPVEKIYLAYGAYNKENFKLVTPKTTTFQYDLGSYLLAIGASYSHKNIDRTLEAYSKIKEKINHKLVIIGGRKEYTTFLKIRVKNLDIGEDIKFLDYVSPSDLPSLYSGATTLIFPSLYEGFGIPPLEAMACGCPVIVSNIASLPEVCGDAAYYVDPYSIDSIAEGIYKVLTDEDLRKTFIERGLERVKLFSWENTAKRILKVFEEVLHS